MKYLIIDDEPLAREGIKLNAERIDFLEYCGEYSNPIQAIEYLNKNNVDIIFLDIEMPGLSGLQFLENTTYNVQIIFTTAYPQYAIEAFEHHVTDYLVKPVRFERFFKAVTKAKENYELLQHSTIEVGGEDQFVYIRSERTIIKVILNEIKYIKGLKDYVMIYTLDNKYITAMNVKTIFSKLPHTIFARVSKSYIVNVDRIESINNHDILIDEMEISIGEAYRKAFYSTHINDKVIERKK